MKERGKRRPRGHGGRELSPVQEQLLVREHEVGAGEVSKRGNVGFCQLIHVL